MEFSLALGMEFILPLTVISIDCNRFTIDARYGKYFNGEKFAKHAVGGYDNCITDSLQSINKIWENYLLKSQLLFNHLSCMEALDTDEQ